MGSSPTSRLRFLTSEGADLDAPLEWSRGLIEITCSPADWQQAVLLRNEERVSVYVKELAGSARVLADWPLLGAGNFALELDFKDGSWHEKRVCKVAPRKLTPAAVEQMLLDLQQRLPASIAIALQRGGALSGIDIVAPRETTLAEELHRLTRAVDGTEGRVGLVRVMQLLSDRPHQVLRAYEQWTDRERARRIDPARLPQAFSRPGNLDRDRRPLLVPERPVEHSVNTYENQLVKAFHNQVNTRLRMLSAALRRRDSIDLADEATGLLRRLEIGRRTASFLDAVSDLTEPPGRVTMVLLKRSEYRAALEGFLEFRRRALVHLREPALDAPLQDLPFLYQTWGVLAVITATLELAADLGYRVRKEALSSRVAGEVWIQLLRDGRPAVVLTHDQFPLTVKLIPQRTYGLGVAGLRSISFRQIPDIAVEVTDHERTHVYIFDPKYKLDSENLDGEETHARPKKVDIDAMHSYRDAIRNATGERVVRYAAILYPGPTRAYTNGLAALAAQPQDPLGIEASVRAVLTPALASSPIGTETCAATAVKLDLPPA